MRVEKELTQKARKAFRAVFMYRGATRHYAYFDSHIEALKASDYRTRYLMGSLHPTIDYPVRMNIEVRGPRGGWVKIQNVY